jgi:predicted MPP superfamily phosphohydrolase
MRRLRRLLPTAVLLVVFWIGLLGLLEARSDPVVRRATIAIDRLPHGTPPLRLVLVSDIHVGNPAMPVRRLERIVDQINAQHADAVLIAGDLVNGDSPRSKLFKPDLFVAPLSRLRAPLGVYASMGNHDEETRPEVVKAALRRAGVKVLEDSSVRLGPFALIGASFKPRRRKGEFPMFPAARKLGGVPVVMTHIPPDPRFIAVDVPLVLAGHTHCGQIVLGKWDNSFNLMQWQPRFDPQFRCGFAHARNYTILVTGGVGASSVLPIRIGAPPDFWVITLTGRRN